MGSTEAAKVDFAIGWMVNPSPPWGSVMVGTGSPSRLGMNLQYLQCNIHISGGNPAGWRPANTRALTPKFQQRSLDTYLSIFTPNTLTLLLQA